MTLISPENDLALMAVLFVIAGAAFLAEKTRVGAHLTGAVIAILSAIAVANLRIIPHSAPAFDFVFSYFVPILIPLFLFKADLRHMLFETTRMTGAFLIASAGTVLGVVLLYFDAFFQSMAVVLIFGLSFATILTLIIVPVLYAIFFRVHAAR